MKPLEKRMAEIKDMDKWCPLRRSKQFNQAFLKLDAKRFDQTFLKFDTWCESTRGRSAKRRREEVKKHLFLGRKAVKRNLCFSGQAFFSKERL